MASFRFQNRYVLLTYSQCGDLDPFKIVDLISSYNGECIIGRESHEDRGTHLHAFVDFNRTKKFSKQDCFDIDGYHPNIAPMTRGQPGDMWDYATKDGDIVGGGLLDRPETTSGRKRKTAEQTNPEELKRLRTMTSETELDEALWDIFGERYILSYGNIASFKRDILKPKPTPYKNPEGLVIDYEAYPELKHWVEENIEGFKLGGKIVFFIIHDVVAAVTSFHDSGGSSQRLLLSAQVS